MPKKRHQTKYSKPQSTAPASLSSTGSSNNNNNNSVPHSESRSVNQLLASLRRVGINNGSHNPSSLAVHPTVPPAIRNILQLPETPAPRPRRPVRRDASGRRLPPGPAAPRSWVAPSGPDLRRRRNRKQQAIALALRPLPCSYDYLPAKGSLMDMALQRFARDWDFQKEYCQYYIYDLPTHMRMPLVRYVALYNADGISVSDLRAILLPPPPDPEGQEEPAREEEDPSWVNENFTHLDLTGSCGRSLKLRELTELLSPPSPEPAELPDSWDAVDEQDGPAVAAGVSVPRPLLPTLTHLSLAVDPDIPVSSISWRQLLTFASHQQNLTHLSLAFWPEPNLTPNAKYSSVVSEEGRVVQYGGTGAYSHTLDNDWSEAVLVLSRLSRCLYELEYLDLTGCASWSPALWTREDHDAVDWVRHWGKISTVLLCPGYDLPDDAGVGETIEYGQLQGHPRTLERHVRSARAGRGRLFTVDTNGRGSGTDS